MERGERFEFELEFKIGFDSEDPQIERFDSSVEISSSKFGPFDKTYKAHYDVRLNIHGLYDKVY